MDVLAKVFKASSSSSPTASRGRGRPRIVFAISFVRVLAITSKIVPRVKEERRSRWSYLPSIIYYSSVFCGLDWKLNVFGVNVLSNV